jgi:hypothetical protein
VPLVDCAKQPPDGCAFRIWNLGIIAECSQDLGPAHRYCRGMSNPGPNHRSTDPDLPELPPERAFVVEFRDVGTIGPDESALSGRVEHVVSGRAARFESAGELLDFVRGVLSLRA